MKKLIKKGFSFFGLDIIRLKKKNVLVTKNWMSEYDFKTIIDIGANVGQAATGFRKMYPNSKIISFEPIPSVFDLLIENFSDDNNFIAYNCGIGDSEGELSFNLNDYTPSSSLLKMTTLHKEAFQQTQIEKKIKVKIELLDKILFDTLIKKPLLIKMDVQGFEDRVIDGGNVTIDSADLIIIEISFSKLYEDQASFDDIYSRLKKLNFEYIGNLFEKKSPLDGIPLYVDAIFKKKK